MEIGLFSFHDDKGSLQKKNASNFLSKRVKKGKMRK